MAILTTGSYGSRGTFIITIAALVDLPRYTLGLFGAIRLFLAFRRESTEGNHEALADSGAITIMNLVNEIAGGTAIADCSK